MNVFITFLCGYHQVVQQTHKKFFFLKEEVSPLQIVNTVFE